MICSGFPPLPFIILDHIVRTLRQHIAVNHSFACHPLASFREPAQDEKSIVPFVFS